MLKKLALAGALCCALIDSAWAQSSPGFVTGQVPSAAQWNSYFAGKVDVGGVGNVTASMLASGAAAGNLGAAIGTSGATICILNASCTWSGQHLFGSDWLSAIIPSTTTIANVASLSTNGNYGLIGASQSSYLTAPGHMSTIGMGGFALNDNSTYANTAYAFYGEARRYAGAGTTHGMELDIINEDTTVQLGPYDSAGQAGLTLGGWLSSGRQDVGSSTTATAALGIINNGAAFYRGIVFGSNAINSGSSFGEAISMAQNQQLAWYSPDNSAAAYIWSGITATGQKGQRLVFTDLGPQYQNSAGNGLWTVNAPSTAVNGLTLAPSSTGNVPILSATGSDTAIGWAFRTKGGQPFYLQGGDGATALQVSPVTGAVNYAVDVAAATGNPVQIKASGSDTNVSLSLMPQGSGAINLGTNGTLVDGLSVTGAATGGTTIIAAAGTDTNIPLAIRSKGGSQAILLQNSSGATAFEAAPVASGVNYLVAVGAIATYPAKIMAQGSDTNINIALSPQGTGVVTVGASGIQLPAFTVSALPTCGVAAPAGTVAYVTDATAPAYNATLAGSGAVKTLAMCNGSAWTAH